MQNLVNFLRLVAISLILIAGGPLMAQPLSAPFCTIFPMEVLCPSSLGHDVPNVEEFVNLAKRGDRVFATFHSHRKGLGIMILNGKTLQVEGIHWPFPEEEKVGQLRWNGMASSNAYGVVAVCSGTQEKEAVGTTYLVTYSNSNGAFAWRKQKIQCEEEVVATALIGDTAAIAMITKPSNSFIRYDLRTGERTVFKDIFDFIPHEYPCSDFLYSTRGGEVYGSYKGRLFCFHDSMRFFEYLGPLPCQYGHLSTATLAAMASDNKGLLVGGTDGDGFLFTVDVKNRKVRPWGRPTDNPRIRKLICAPPSGFWGISETPGQSCRLFRLQPDKFVLEDLGIPAGRLREGDRTWTWHAFRIADLLVLNDGRILLAEGAAQAKLLVLDPGTNGKTPERQRPAELPS